MSAAEKCRQEGNNYYKLVHENMNPEVAIAYLKLSQTLYQESLNKSMCNSEIASALKNLSSTSYKLAMFTSKADEKWIHFKESFRYFNEAFTVGKNSMNQAWIEHIMTHLLQCWQDLICFLRSTAKDQLEIASKVKEVVHMFTIENVQTQLECFLDIARAHLQSQMSGVSNLAMHNEGGIMFIRGMSRLRQKRNRSITCHFMYVCVVEMDGWERKLWLKVTLARSSWMNGVTAIDTADYSNCLYQMKECYFPLNEAARVGAELEKVQQEVRKLDEDMNRLTRLAKAMQFRATGDNLFQTILMDEEHIDTEKVWVITECYKDSILQVHDLDIEQEAISLSKLALVYDRVLKIPFMAKEYSLRSVGLAHALGQMNLTGKDWYQNCTQILQKYQ